MKKRKKNIRGLIAGIGMLLCLILAFWTLPEKVEAASKSPYYFEVSIKRGSQVSALRVYVTYKGDKGDTGYPDFSKSQDVELSEELISDSNPFNLHLTAKKAKTYQGNVQDKEESPKPREPKEDIAGNTVYISGQYSILVSEYGTVDGLGVGFSYDRPAYTYIDDTSTDNKATGYRINANRYNWNNKSDSTLNTTGINTKKQQDTFYLQVHQHNTGATSTDKNCHAGYIMTLENPSLTVEYYSDGKLIGTDMNAVDYRGGTDETYAVKTFTRLDLTRKGYHAAEPEWVTADGERSFTAGQSYTAFELKPFSNTEKFKTKTVKLEARWEGNGYTMTLDTNGGKFGNGDLKKQIKVTYGKGTGNDQSGKTLVRDGYEFLGFYTKKSGGVQIFGPDGSCKKDGTYWNSKKKWCYLGNAVFYAHWEKSSNTKIYFDANGGTVPRNAVSVIKGGTQNNNVAWNAPERPGYEFAGWKRKKENGTYGKLIYHADGSYNSGADAWSADGKYQFDYSITVVAQWNIKNYTITLHPNGGTLGGSTAAKALSPQVSYGSGNWNTVTTLIPVRSGYAFLGWYDGDNELVYDSKGYSQAGTYWQGSGTAAVWQYSGDAIFYAHWEPIEYTITLDPNGGTLNGSTTAKALSPSVKCGSGNWNNLASQIPVREGYKFEGWYTAKTGGTLVYDSAGTCRKGTYWSATGGSAVWQYAGNAVFYAHWKVNSFNIVLHAGNGIESVSGGGSYTCGTAVTISAELKPGYHWTGWTGWPGTEHIANITCTFTMPEQNLELTANGEANRYTIHFDANRGAEISHIADIVAEYDTEVTLPDITGNDGTAAYVKYTLDGVNVTQDVLAGSLPQAVIAGLEETAKAAGTEEADRVREADVTEREAETFKTESAEETAGEGESVEVESADRKEAAAPIQKVYPSVFLGWSLEENKDALAPQWKAGDTVSNLVEEQDGEITLYAVWDDCPWIVANDRYYTLKQAQSGFITEAEILSHATASDREDGSPIEPGFHDNGTSFSIPDYQESDFTQFQRDGSCTENLTVVDSSGSVYVKQITIYVVDTSPQPVKTATTRFINEKYYYADYEHGGLPDDSIWKTDPEYKAALLEAFENLKNGTPERTYHFTHEDILEMKQFVTDHGIGNSKEPDALSKFYEKFLVPNEVK